jgi:hypothetical protein
LNTVFPLADGAGDVGAATAAAQLARLRDATRVHRLSDAPRRHGVQLKTEKLNKGLPSTV